MPRYHNSLICVFFLLLSTAGGSQNEDGIDDETFEQFRLLGPKPAGPTPIPMIARDAHGTAVAWIVFGGVLMITVTFYLISSKDDRIKDATWLVVSNAVALFCAILLFLAFRELVALITQGEDIQSRRLMEISEISEWRSEPWRQLAGGSYDQCWGSSSSSSSSSSASSYSNTASHSSAGGRLLFSHSPSSASHRRLALPPTQETLIIDALCFVVVFITWEAILWFLRKTVYGLPALGLVAAHCMGFAALYTFANLQQCEPFRNGPGSSVLVAVGGFVALIIFSQILNAARNCFVHWFQRRHGCVGGDQDSHIDHEHAWGHQCEHTERKAVSFAVSYLIAQFLKHVSRGDLAPLHDVPKGHEVKSSTDELLFGLGLAFLVIIFGYIEHKVAERDGNAHLEDIAPDLPYCLDVAPPSSTLPTERLRKRRKLRLGDAKYLIILVVCCLDGLWVEWSTDSAELSCLPVFWSSTNDNGLLGDGDIMTSQVVVVVISYIFSFSVFFVLHFSGKCVNAHLARGFRALCKSVMLLLGLAWEGAFWEGAHYITMGFKLKDRSTRMSMVVVEGALFCAIVLPAWIMFIVPHTLKIHGGEAHMRDYDDSEAGKSEAVGHLGSHIEDEDHAKEEQEVASQKVSPSAVNENRNDEAVEKDRGIVTALDCPEVNLKDDTLEVGARGHAMTRPNKYSI